MCLQYITNHSRSFTLHYFKNKIQIHSMKITIKIEKNQTNITKYFWTNSEPTTWMNAADVWCATAFTIIVSIFVQMKYKTLLKHNNGATMEKDILPVPGGPYSNTPRGGSMPICAYKSKCVNGNSII